jgi:hypothetical protein
MEFMPYRREGNTRSKQRVTIAIDKNIVEEIGYRKHRGRVEAISLREPLSSGGRDSESSGGNPWTSTN